MSAAKMFQFMKIELNRTVKRLFSVTSLTCNKHKLWPYEKFRRIGRRPPVWRGQKIGGKSRLAYDKRYPLSGKDINETTEGLQRGGNIHMRKMIGEERSKHNSAVIRYYDYKYDRDVTELVPEMIPEFIVPDLTNFELKPYVSYRVDNSVQTQPRHTASQLFQDTYQQDIIKTSNKDNS